MYQPYQYKPLKYKGTAPIPLAASGAANQMAYATNAYGQAVNDTGADYDTRLLDYGLGQKTVSRNGKKMLEYYQMARGENPTGIMQQITNAAERNSAGRGFGFTGRTQQLDAFIPREKAKMQLTKENIYANRNLRDYSQQLAQSMGQAYNQGANYAQDIGFYKTPSKMQFMNQYRKFLGR